MTFDPPSTVGAGQLFDYMGRPISDPLCDFSAERKANGLIIIITHGLTAENTGSDWWPFEMAQAIKDRYAFLGTDSERPNILVYDWTDDARPVDRDDPKLQEHIKNAKILIEVGLKAYSLLKSPIKYIADTVVGWIPGGKYVVAGGDAAMGDFLGAYGQVGVDVSVDLAALAGEKLGNVLYIKGIALSTGDSLSNWIALNSRPSEIIEPTAPIHLIGHSAGGFVVGQCAYLLKSQSNLVVDRVTMLDTPAPEVKHLSTLLDPVYVERINSSWMGRYVRSYSVWKLPLVYPYLQEYDTPDYTGSLTDYTSVFGHGWSHGWYLSTIELEHYQTPIQPTGFELSPFSYGPKANKITPLYSMSLRSEPLMLSEAAADPWAIFTGYGDISGSGVERILSENSDAGLYVDTVLSDGATSLSFSFYFENLSDGDFLAVAFGDQLLRSFANLQSYAGSYRSVNIPIGHIAGDMGRLTFNLVSRGDPNAILYLKDFIIQDDDDIDNDGLSNADEALAGTDSSDWDTDSDGVPDGLEAPDSDPLLADTDADGSNDLAERISGTDARDANSVFKVSQIQGGTGSFALWWKSVSPVRLIA